MTKAQLFYLPFKRLIGLTGSIIGIILCVGLVWWWVLIFNSIATKGHPIFIQRRVGKNGKLFKCIKFRTMELNTNPNMPSLTIDSGRITSFGSFLRKSSIDETLQLFNIFVGQMAFIGPRPLIDAGEDALTISLRKENGSSSLRPGLSGFAQIYKRGDLDPVTKAKYDGEYYKRISFAFDIKIFVCTILKLFRSVKGR